MAGRGIGGLLRGVRAGDAKSITNRQELRGGGALELRSPAFADGEAIPSRHAGRGIGDNVSPALAWAGLPPETEQLLFIMEDVDVPLPRPIIHTIALLAPSLPGVVDGALAQDGEGIRLVPGVFGRIGYAGPRPIPGHGQHRYGFHLYALGVAIPSTTRVRSVGALFPLVAGQVLASGHLIGVYEQA